MKLKKGILAFLLSDLFIVCALLIFSTGVNAFGDEVSQDHLEPVKNISEYSEDLKKYREDLPVLLYRGFKEQPSARCTVKPSFSHEYTVSVKTKNNNYFLLANYLSDNYWYAMRREESENVEVYSNQLEIDEEFYKLIVKLFGLATSQIKEPEGMTIGFDGITYLFSTTDKSGEVLTGKKWSPSKGKIGCLADICDGLFNLTKQQEPSKETIKKDAEVLIKRFKAKPPSFTKKQAAEVVRQFLREVDPDDCEHYRGSFRGVSSDSIAIRVTQPNETNKLSLKAWNRILSQAYSSGLISDTEAYAKNKENYYFSVISWPQDPGELIKPGGPTMTFVINRRTGEIEFFYEQF